ncbi:hypothetical protein [Octadecabacter sp. R77987]|uniref:hypothetical protein n=1 Tax=Octadecabacter sp. R77987 TaxID=3093874 RepID=UPI00366CBEBE
MKNLHALATLILTITFVISPAFTDPFMGFREDQLPIPQTDPPVQPAGYAFSIWGLIYGWLVVSAGFGIWKRADDPAWNAMRAPLIISLALGTPWLAIANASAIWATAVIWGMAGFAIAALIRAPHADRWWAQAPVALYAGWLTAAGFVSLGSTAAGYGLLTDSFGWALICIAGASIIAIAVQQMRKGAPEYSAAVIWALIGIIVAGPSALVSTAALVGIAILIALNVVNLRAA